MYKESRSGDLLKWTSAREQGRLSRHLTSRTYPLFIYYAARASHEHSNYTLNVESINRWGWNVKDELPTTPPHSTLDVLNWNLKRTLCGATVTCTTRSTSQLNSCQFILFVEHSLNCLRLYTVPPSQKYTYRLYVG